MRPAGWRGPRPAYRTVGRRDRQRPGVDAQRAVDGQPVADRQADAADHLGKDRHLAVVVAQVLRPGDIPVIRQVLIAPPLIIDPLPPPAEGTGVQLTMPDQVLSHPHQVGL